MKEIKIKDWDKKRLSETVREFKKKKILVIGDLGLDQYTYGDVERISPEAPVPILHVSRQEFKLGLAANVSDNLHSLGAKSSLVGVLGKDAAGDQLKKILSKIKVKKESLIVDSSRPTILKERIVTEQQQLLRVDFEDLNRFSPKIENQILQKFKREIKNSHAVILEDYSKGIFHPSFTKKVVQIAKQASVDVFADANAKSPIACYEGSFLVKPNRKEAEALSGVELDGTKSILKAGKIILEKTKAKVLVITLGKEGMILFDTRSDEIFKIPTTSREVYDVSGAGDTVISILTLALCSGASLPEAAILGNLGAGVVVAKKGTATCSPKEIMDAMDYFSSKG